MPKEDRKIYVVGGDSNYANWMNGEVVDSMDKANLVVFTGGEDVTPAFYNHRIHPTTSYNWKRDEREKEEFQKARDIGLPLIGICRGSQFLCVMAGGVLIQHQQHPRQHEIQTYKEKTITVTSTHHQRQFPWAGSHPSFTLLGWCEPDTSPYSYFGDGKDNNNSGNNEVEIAYYAGIRALAIQSHPEFCWPCQEDWHKEYIGFCRHLLDRHMKGLGF